MISMKSKEDLHFVEMVENYLGANKNSSLVFDV
jgi:hypothetical protein